MVNSLAAAPPAYWHLLPPFSMELGWMVTTTLFPEPAALNSSPSPVGVKAVSPDAGTDTDPVPIPTVVLPTALGVSSITLTSEIGMSPGAERNGTSTEMGM